MTRLIAGLPVIGGVAIPVRLEIRYAALLGAADR